MEKKLWMVLGVFGIGLHSVARAEGPTFSPPPRPMIISVAAPLMPLPTRIQPITKLLNLSTPTGVTESKFAETAGAAVIGFAALWAARRRRLI
jgi:MYXO-CTERM domain-containing protein